MEFIFLFIYIAAIVVTLLIPWVNFIRISLLSRKIDKLLQKNRLHDSKDEIESGVNPKPKLKKSSKPKQTAKACSKADKWQDNSTEVELPNISEKLSQFQNNLSSRDWDIIAGPKLPVWIGSIALILAGFYLMKYSIQQNLLSPLVRVMLGYLFGGGLLTAAMYIVKQNNFTNGKRISQALAGSAFAIFYGGSYVATNVYGLLPSTFGFMLMIVVTITAALCALKFGEPIALIALAGGMVTPMIFKSQNPNLLYLFVYLYFIFTGILSIAIKKQWTGLIITAIVFLITWFVIIIELMLTAENIFYLLLFMLISYITLTFSIKDQIKSYYHNSERSNKILVLSQVVTGFIVMSLMEYLATVISFGLGEWMLLFTLMLALLFLSYFQEELYMSAVASICALNLFLIAIWHYPTTQIYMGTLITIIYVPVIVMHQHLMRCRKPIFWSALMSGISLLGFIIGYQRLSVVDNYVLEALLIGLLLAVIVFTYVIYLNRHYQNPLYKESVLSLFCLCSGAFVATGLGTYFTYHYLPIAIAFELLLAVLLYAHTGISGLLNLTKCLFIAILVLMIPEWISILGFAAERIFNDSIYHALPKEYMLQPWISFGLPIVAMSGAVYMLRKEKAFSMSLAKAILLFLTLFVYFSIRYTFHETSELYFVRETVIESVIYNSLCYIAAYIFYRGFCHLRWDALLKTAWIFFVIAGLRVVYFDCILLNPLWYELSIRGWFVLNSLNLIYLVPIIASIFVYHGLYGNGYDRYYTKVLWLIAFTGFCYISFQVRYLFQGNLLLSSGFNHLELYAYSVVWLLYAIIVLFLGAFMREVTLRHIAILLFSLSILKVFFVDSYELDGLYRVFSFLCLGIILLAVSSLYTRLANKLTKQAA